uniref:C2H2-type domain-containing protein n=1 Tax=Leptobrachium leishanense TaxID=445787 RepID=A0A8C5QMD6_9ANUR
MNSAEKGILKEDPSSVKVEHTEDFVRCVIRSEDHSEGDIHTYIKTEDGTTSHKLHTAPFCWTIKDNVVWCSKDKGNLVFSSKPSKDEETCPSQPVTEHYQIGSGNGPLLASIQQPDPTKTDPTDVIKKQVLPVANKHESLRNRNKSDQAHRCETCGKSFKKRSKLTAHKIAHSSERPFSCSVCSRRFARKFDKKRHEWTHKRINKNRSEGNSSSSIKKRKKRICKYNCRECGKPFSDYLSLLRHENVHKKKSVAEPKDPSLYKCTMCDMTFTRPSYVVEHMLIHTGGQTLFICQECGKRFVSTSALAKHQKSHSSEPEEITANHSGDIKKEKTEECEGDLKNLSSSVPQTSLASENPSIHSNHSKIVDQKFGVTEHKKCENAQSVHSGDLRSSDLTPHASLLKQQKIHLTKPPFVYRDRGRTYACRSPFDNRRETHKKVYICTGCGESFSNYPYFIKHQESCASLKIEMEYR